MEHLQGLLVKGGYTEKEMANMISSYTADSFLKTK
jgi:hypothetical protein